MFAAPLPGFRDLPLAHVEVGGSVDVDGPVVSFRGDNDGFIVDEIPAYLPSGQGDHLYLHIQKRGVSTPEVWKRLRSAFGVREVEIGTAGQKDARGVTSQWMSVPARAVEPRLAEVESALGVTLLEAKRHNHKLRLGHLRGNRFSCRLDDVDAAAAAAIADRAAAVARHGCPNYFGAQRFGHGDRALRDGERFLARPRPAKTKREQFWVSAVQSVLFNAWLAERVRGGAFLCALDGDILEKPTGASFECQDPATDTPRVAAGEVSPSGPLYGRAMRCAQRDALTWESRSLTALGVSHPDLLAHPAFNTGTRRAARLWVTDVETRVEAGALWLCFTLPAGAYASVFLREVVGPRLRDLFFEEPPAAAPEPGVSDDDRSD